MKKLAFAIQVFGIIAMFPIVMILELNRSNVRSAESDSIFKHQVEMKNIFLIKNVTGKLEKDVFPATAEIVLLQAFKK